MNPRRALPGATGWAALAAMALMLASLPEMQRACGGLGWTAPQMLALHAAAMLLPAGLAGWRPGTVRPGMGLAFAASGLCLWAMPGLTGLMWASTCQAVACGLHMGRHRARLVGLWLLVPGAAVLLPQAGLLDPAWWVPLHAAVAALGVWGACGVWAVGPRVTLGASPQAAAPSQRQGPWPRTTDSAKPTTNASWNRCTWS